MQLDRREEDGGTGGEQRGIERWREETERMTGWREGDNTDKRDRKED